LFLVRLDATEIPLVVFTDVKLVVFVPEGLVLMKDDMGALPLTLPNGLPFSSIRESLIP
jgi:hypothetical protein